MAGPLGFERLWALRQNFILIYFRVKSIIRLGEHIDFNLITSNQPYGHARCIFQHA